MNPEDIKIVRQVKPVISYRNLSRQPPIKWTLIIVLLVKAFRLYDTLFGAVVIGILFCGIALAWTLFIIDTYKYTETPVNIFENHVKKDNN